MGKWTTPQAPDAGLPPVGLTSDPHKLATLLGVDAGTLRQWRPERVQELLALLRRLLAGPYLARAWLHIATPPADVMSTGRIPPVLAVLRTLELGG